MRKVLIVDDDPFIRKLIATTLEDVAGFDLQEAADGVEALELVRAHRPDAIVLDMVLPRVDGFGVLERLHADPETRGIPVVVLTAKQLSPEERAVLRTRAVLLLEKSDYSARELRELIRQALAAPAVTG